MAIGSDIRFQTQPYLLRSDPYGRRSPAREVGVSGGPPYTGQSSKPVLQLSRIYVDRGVSRQRRAIDDH